jgi:hypothetical protein
MQTTFSCIRQLSVPASLSLSKAPTAKVGRMRLECFYNTELIARYARSTSRICLGCSLSFKICSFTEILITELLAATVPETAGETKYSRVKYRLCACYHGDARHLALQAKIKNARLVSCPPTHRFFASFLPCFIMGEERPSFLKCDEIQDKGRQDGPTG